MITRSELAKDKAVCKDSACGALIGLAIGDSFGDAARTVENHKRYGITMDFQDKASWSTDDTEFALLTAQMLIDTSGELTVEDVLEAWKTHVVVEDELNRGGGSEKDAASNISRGIYPPDSGRFNSRFNSDGAAMRIAPIGMVCAGDPQRAADLAEIDGQISHWQDGIWGAQAVAAAVSVAMVGATVDEIIEVAISMAPEKSWLRYNFEKAMAIVASAPSLEAAWMPLHRELYCDYHGAAPEAIPEALAVLKLTEGDFRRGIIFSGNFGRDADTIAAILGGISGAMHGLSGIPSDWVEKTRYPTGTCLQFTKDLDILAVAGQLAQLIR